MSRKQKALLGLALAVPIAAIALAASAIADYERLNCIPDDYHCPECPERELVMLLAQTRHHMRALQEHLAKAPGTDPDRARLERALKEGTLLESRLVVVVGPRLAGQARP